MSDIIYNQTTILNLINISSQNIEKIDIYIQTTKRQQQHAMIFRCYNSYIAYIIKFYRKLNILKTKKKDIIILKENVRSLNKQINELSENSDMHDILVSIKDVITCFDVIKKYFDSLKEIKKELIFKRQNVKNLWNIFSMIENNLYSYLQTYKSEYDYYYYVFHYPSWNFIELRSEEEQYKVHDFAKTCIDEFDDLCNLLPDIGDIINIIEFYSKFD